jgi:tetratricopeptide (TPR) repeat protein
MRNRPEGYHIIPITDSANPLLAGPYESLDKMFWLVVEGRGNQQNEGVLRRLCAELSIIYVPPSVSARTVYTERFLSELEERHHGISVAQRLELNETIAFFNEQLAMPQPDWIAVQESILAFQYKTRREGLGSWYYPLVMKGLCQLELADLAGAERTLSDAVKHPLSDEHAFALLGFVHYRQGRNLEAIDKLNEALRRCRSGAWELKIDLLTVLHQAGHNIDVEEAICGVDLTPLLVEDWVKVMNLRGVAFYDQDKYQQALRVLSDVWERTDKGRPVADDVTAVYLAETLKKLKRFEEACAVLRKAAQSLQNDNLYHHLATLLYERGRISDSFEVYELLRRPRFRRRIYAVGYARRLFLQRKAALMREVCREVVSPNLYGIPRTAEDFWHCGFTQFLMGNIELSEYDRSRGLAYSKKKYEEVL